MEHVIAVEMIRKGVNSPSPSKWIELGAGHGTFTLALADLLAPGSSIIALDTDSNALKSIPATFRQVTIKKVISDFMNTVLPIHLDGVLAANALHFVSDRVPLLQTVRESMVPGGTFIVIEYDVAAPTPWIPYPVPVSHLNELSTKAGFTGFQVLDQRRSGYGEWNIYSAAMNAP